MTQGQDMPKGPWIDDIMFLSADTSKHIWEIKNWRFFSYKCPPLEKKLFLKIIFFPSGGHLEGKKIFNFEFLKSDLRYQHQIFTSCLPQ